MALVKLPFGHKFYWRSGVFGALLGLAEFSLVTNLKKLDYKKDEIAQISR